MRRVAEINAIAKLQAMSQTKEFTQAAAQAASAPLPCRPGFGQQSRVHDLQRSERHMGFSQSNGRGGEASHRRPGSRCGGRQRRGELDPLKNQTRSRHQARGRSLHYERSLSDQKELNKVAWPAFLGKFTVDLGMAAVGGVALSAVNWTSTLTDALRDKSPAELRLMNLGLLTDNMGRRTLGCGRLPQQ
jgi:hypothetical protein